MLDFFRKFLRNKKAVAITTGIIVVAVASATYFILTKPELRKIARTVIPQIKEPSFFCEVDGTKIEEKNVDRKPLAVMVENSSDIRPQSGLSQACVVFEALAEGGITRFLVIYARGQNVKKIGPVRSARPYYVSIARAFNPIYAHVGFSTAGGKKIKETGIDDLDQFSHESSYWRDSSRRAPHNVFTSKAKLYEGAKKAGYSKLANYDGFDFKTKEKKSKKKQIITIDFSYRAYKVSYEYKPSTNSYDRSNGGSLQRDANNNKTISPKNVVVLYAKTNNAIGETLNIQIEGRGRALYFIDGRTIKGKWTKLNASTQFSFYDVNDKPVELNRGQTWVEVVKTDSKVKY